MTTSEMEPTTDEPNWEINISKAYPSNKNVSFGLAFPMAGGGLMSSVAQWDETVQQIVDVLSALPDYTVNAFRFINYQGTVTPTEV